MREKRGINAFVLHVMAMVLMLCDHLWATLFPAQEWMTCIGRMAFPIFAFMIVEGYIHTSNVKKYLGRMLLFAVISEIPFNLIYGSSFVYPFHQNVLWTFVIALVSIIVCEKAKATKKWWIFGSVVLMTLVVDYVLGNLTMVDYFGVGVLTVMVFYLFHGNYWWCYLGQILSLGFLNIKLLGTYFYTISIEDIEIKIVQQGLALVALLPIWLYNGKQGYHSKTFQYICYAFYPVHLLVLYMIWQFVI